ncbi:MAG: amidase family protein [Actinomycetota bacterium]|nr:amidase family protein [Actinomycetota bacterium]
MVTTAQQDLAFAGPGALAELVRSGQVHPRELVELCLERIERLNPQVNAFRVVLGEEALAQCDGAAASGGPLAGVPIAVKDDTPVAGQATTRGSRSYGPPNSGDAEVIRRLRAAGAIPIGITNVPELTIFPWTASDANGITRNPWNPARTPGGSSGGSGAAVASGMVPAATGSDGGGSIRIPAACCGLVGMKPSRGRVSLHPAREGWLGLATYGPLTRTVADSALLLDAMHGTVPGEAHSLPPHEGSFRAACSRPPGQLRIAASRKVPPGLIASVSSEQRGAWESMASLLTDLGHEVIDRDPAYGLAQLEFLQTWVRGIYEESLTIPDPSKLERLTRQMAGAGRVLVPPRRKQSLLSKRPATVGRILALWGEADVLLTPGLAVTAIAAEGAYGKPAPLAINTAGRFTPFTPVFNVTGQPAVSIPAGLGIDGLPLSVQLVGRPGAEETLYSLAAQIEEARPWAQRRPPSS